VVSVTQYQSRFSKRIGASGDVRMEGKERIYIQVPNMEISHPHRSTASNSMHHLTKGQHPFFHGEFGLMAKEVLSSTANKPNYYKIVTIIPQTVGELEAHAKLRRILDIFQASYWLELFTGKHKIQCND
jgi:hypothetical protein